MELGDDCDRIFVSHFSDPLEATRKCLFACPSTTNRAEDPKIHSELQDALRTIPRET